MSEKKFPIFEKVNCIDFGKTFKVLYNMLAEYGEKSKFHLNIQKKTSPPRTMDLIRKYCSSPEKIPDNQKIWWMSFFTDQISLEIEEKKEMAKEFISSADEMIKLLNYFLENEKEKINHQISQKNKNI